MATPPVNYSLFLVNTETGELTSIGKIRNSQGKGFKKVYALSFHPDGSLWGHEVVTPEPEFFVVDSVEMSYFAFWLELRQMELRLFMFMDWD